MVKVTQRIKEIKQPRGGYIKPSMYNKKVLEDGKKLNENENVHASIIGLVVDYMSRFLMGLPIEEAFKISMMGFARKVDLTKPKETPIKKLFGKTKDPFYRLAFLLNNIKGLDDNSLIHACKLVSYDVWFRDPFGAMMCKTEDEINPDAETLENIRIMIERSVEFFNTYGPITVNGFVFADDTHNGYTDTVDSGDGDFLTKDTMWDFKVTKTEIQNKHTLQILMYYLMGKHSKMEIYKDITKTGFFNPRLNTVYILDMSTVPEETIETVEKEVIGY